ncbi:MAG: N-acetyltransferase [Candidatus Marinimicrobia bacterium]|nr:N-acetyltransferase [Candidatus Neomarinimicrobiota bacterium]
MTLRNIHIRETSAIDLNAILAVERTAFIDDEEVVTLTRDLLTDPTAEPLVSLLAFDGETPVGHILFTKAQIVGVDRCPLMHILAPLAVIPDYQKQGIGGKLIRAGLEKLRVLGSERCFVIGHMDYYPRYGFIPDAAAQSFPAPYPIPEKDKDAWMVQDLVEKATEIKGQIICADVMMKPEYWKE